MIARVVAAVVVNAPNSTSATATSNPRHWPDHYQRECKHKLFFVSEQSAYFDVEGVRAMAVVPLNHENKVAETFIGANRGTVFM